jgi:fatty acid desaturase
MKTMTKTIMTPALPGVLARDRAGGMKKAHSRKPKVHKFSDDIITRVRSCFKTDNFHGVLELLEDWAVIFGAAWGSLYAWRQLPTLLAVVLYAIAIFLIGGRQRGLADILHQASHGTLVKSRRFGILLGTAFSGYPLLQSFTGYFASHVLAHHPYLADPELDPDYVEYRRRGLTGSNLRRDVLKRYLISLVGVRSVVGYCRYLLKNRIVNSQEWVVERWIRLIYLSMAFVICVWNGWLIIVFAYWLVPLFTTHAWIGAFIELL